MKKAHYQELGHLVGLALTGGANPEEGGQHGMAKGDRLLFLEGLSRVRCEPLEVTWEKDGEDSDWWELEQLARALKKYKKAQGLVDYTDMLHRFCEEGYAPKLDILFVDEAQDLSTLQWRVVHKLMAHAARTIVAGDDDQAIFRWSGADVDTFVTLPGTPQVLGQSYRISGAVHNFATNLIGTVAQRRPKAFRPATHVGSVSYRTGLEDLPLDQGEWLILVRNGYMARPVVEYCERNGYPCAWRQPATEGDAPEAPARIRVSTIHGAKGGEADNVALFTDMSHRTYLSMQKHPDDEARVFYVGATRARHHLHVVNPQTAKHFNPGGA
jgi:superfamily I DNA/RNA helicase